MKAPVRPGLLFIGFAEPTKIFVMSAMQSSYIKTGASVWQHGIFSLP